MSTIIFVILESFSFQLSKNGSRLQIRRVMHESCIFHLEGLNFKIKIDGTLKSNLGVLAPGSPSLLRPKKRSNRLI